MLAEAIPLEAQSKEATKANTVQGGKKPAKPPINRSGVVRVTTDRTGRVTQAVMVKSIHPALDAEVIKFAIAQWRGPANSTRDVPITLDLDNATIKPVDAKSAAGSH